MRQLIVNADDFALTHLVCNGIIKAHKEGIVTSTSLMINSPHLDYAVKLLKDTPTLDVGIHLNLSWHIPVLTQNKIPSLLDSNGRFYRRLKEIPSTVKIHEMERELSAQIEKGLATGLPISHIDSHHHLHVFNHQFLKLFIKLANRYNLALRFINQDNKNQDNQEDKQEQEGYGNERVITPDYFEGTFFGQDNITLHNLQSIFESLPEGVTELMCHPGEVDNLLRNESSYVNERKMELEILTNTEIKTWLKEKKIKLITYKNLLPSGNNSNLWNSVTST